MVKFQNILVATDTLWDQQPVMPWAIKWAKHNDAKLTIVDVMPDSPWIARVAMPDCDSRQDALAEEKRAALKVLASSAQEQGVEAATKLLAGRTSVAIMHEVLRSQHDLVLKVTKGTRSRRLGFFGTTSLRLLRSCPCAVGLLRPDSGTELRRILAAIDPTPGDVHREVLNGKVLEIAHSVASYSDGETHVVHAWELFGEPMLKSRYEAGELEAAKKSAELRIAAELDRHLSRYRMKHTDDQVHLICDPQGPGHAISDLAKRKRIDLIVMGTIARSGIAATLLGNTAEQVLDRVACGVLALKPDGFISPISTSRN
ncbi:MAG: universal stress protein [Planctomycetota bacterium]